MKEKFRGFLAFALGSVKLTAKMGRCCQKVQIALPSAIAVFWPNAF
ncbi:MAG: hypothetical protein F6J93_07460 [Oscillatoria sp. SIO1A7]|nr:hypothetical protein [Oscillatoria sp. SIO1A7]